jgi:tryptophan halogenase
MIGIIGAGEATIPHIRGFNERIGLEEVEFMRSTAATMKLGIQFSDWHRLGAGSFHPFGETTRRVGGVDLHHHAARYAAAGTPIDEAELSPATLAAHAGVIHARQCF